jgi:hypothetical protein
MATLTDIREELLAQHESLRSLGAKIREVAGRPPTARARGELAVLLHELGDGIDAHNAREEYLLGEVLPTLDAWGAVRLARMDTHHRQEHRQIADEVCAAAGLGDFSAAARRALPVIDSLLEHMRREEAEFLGPNVLRDDVVNIEQSDG